MQIPDFLLFLYDSYKKRFHASNEKNNTGIDVTSIQGATQQLTNNTEQNINSSGTLNESGLLESQDSRLEGSKSGNVKSVETTKPSRLQVYIKHNKVNSSHVGAR